MALSDNYRNPLSEWINKNCSKEFSLIDIDTNLVQWKASKKVMRFFEYKNPNELFHSKTGRTVLEVMAAQFDRANQEEANELKCYVYLVRKVDGKKVEVESLNSKKTKVMDEQEFKKFIEMK